MATSIVFNYEDPTKQYFQVTGTADGDVSPAIPVHHGWLQGGCWSTRSGASNYSALLEYSQDGTNWLTGLTMTQAATSQSFSNALPAGARLWRVTFSTVNSQTITLTVGLSR